MSTTSKYITALDIPTIGERVGAVSGPGEWPKDNAGVVTEVVESRWGRHAVVQMDDGRTDTCHGLTTVGIGWYRLDPAETDTEPAYCLRSDCHELATHLISHYDVSTDVLVNTYALCQFHAPASLMGHSERVYARFVRIAQEATQR
jgi:hypothetical protein